MLTLMSKQYRHHTQNIVVYCVKTYLGRIARRGGRKHHCGIVNAGHIHSTRRLVLHRAQTERVNINSDSWNAWELFKRLDHIVEAGALGCIALVAIELQLGSRQGIAASIGISAVCVIRPAVDIGRDVGIKLDHKCDVLAWMVECQLDLLRARVDRFSAGELQLLDQVLMLNLGEAAALVSVQIHVVDHERGRRQSRNARGRGKAVVGNVASRRGAELYIKGNLMIGFSTTFQQWPDYILP